MKRERSCAFARRSAAQDREIVFLPALTPMEAAVLPAKELPQRYGALAHARASFDFGAERCDQRQKIWVR